MCELSRRDLLCWAEERLREAGVGEAELDAWYLFSDCFQTDRAQFFLHREEKAEPPEAVSRFRALIARRAEREPLQYILGCQEFMGLPFRVNRHVLIPRQDTETLVELVLGRFSGGGEEALSVLDMCTGSGCILISLMKLGPFVHGTGVDLMPGALAVARENARALGVCAEWIQSDLFATLTPRRYDVIVSNPPYISAEELEELAPEVRAYEPREALYAADQGLDFYRRLAAESPGWLADGGRIYVEIGCRQAAAVRELFLRAGFSQIAVHRDLAGLDRVVSAEWRKGCSNNWKCS